MAHTIRIKVEEFYEVEVTDDTIEDAINTIETEMGVGDDPDWYLNNVAIYIGRDFYCEDATHLVHNYHPLNVDE